MHRIRVPLLVPFCCVAGLTACSGDDNDGPELPNAPIGGDPNLVAFPEGYQDYTYTTTVDKEMTQQVRDVYANFVAVSSAESGSLATGSEIVMEIHGAKLDNGQPVLDLNGRYVRDTLNVVAVMRKAPGFGQYNDATRNDRWEYAFYNPDGTPLENELDCYGCHLKDAGPDQDFIFTLDALKAPADLPKAPIGGNPDLVTFPEDYRGYTYAKTVDREDNQQVRDVYANDTAMAGAASGQLGDGSVVIMEIYSALLNNAGAPVLDEGRYVRNTLDIIAVMEKKAGNGQYKPSSRNGEWEYAFFDVEGAPIANQADCNDCHLNMAGPSVDFIFSLDGLQAPPNLSPAPLGGNPDLVTFPANYRDYTLTTTVDKEMTQQVRDVYANDTAKDSAASGKLALGSVIAMDIYSAQLEADGTPSLDANGRFIKDTLNIIAVMEKKAGNGNYSPYNKNGEWEYAFFNPDGTPLPSEADCFGCHKNNTGAATDYIFTWDALLNAP